MSQDNEEVPEPDPVEREEWIRWALERTGELIACCVVHAEHMEHGEDMATSDFLGLAEHLLSVQEGIQLLLHSTSMLMDAQEKLALVVMMAEKQTGMPMAVHRVQIDGVDAGVVLSPDPVVVPDGVPDEWKHE